MMRKMLARLTTYFAAPIVPSSGFQLSRTRLAGLRYLPKERKPAAHVLLRLAAGVLVPAFDRANILEAAPLERAVREAKARLAPEGSDVALLLPEASVRVFILGFDALPAAPAEREEIFRWRLGKIAPFKPADMRLAYDVVKVNGQARVIVALARNDVVQEYERLFSRAGLDVRTVGVPSLHLLNLVRAPHATHALIANIDEDAISLIAVLDGEASLYRMKAFRPEDADAGASPERHDQVLREIENTIHFLEDKEGKRIGTIWLRAAGEDDGEAVLAALRERWPAVRVALFSTPLRLRTQDEQVLSPLVGQVGA